MQQDLAPKIGLRPPSWHYSLIYWPWPDARFASCCLKTELRSKLLLLQWVGQIGSSRSKGYSTIVAQGSATCSLGGRIYGVCDMPHGCDSWTVRHARVSTHVPDLPSLFSYWQEEILPFRNTGFPVMISTVLEKSFDGRLIRQQLSSPASLARKAERLRCNLGPNENEVVSPQPETRLFNSHTFDSAASGSRHLAHCPFADQG